MSGYQTAARPRPQLATGRPETPVVPVERVGRQLLAAVTAAHPGPKDASDPAAAISVEALLRKYRIVVERDPDEARPYTVGDLLVVVMHETGVSRIDILSDRKSQHIVKARQIVCWLAKRHTHQSMPMIGRALGRDHTSCLYATWRVEAVCRTVEPPVDDVPWAWARVLWQHKWPPAGKKADLPRSSAQGEG